MTNVSKTPNNNQEDELMKILPPQPTNVRNTCYNRIPDFLFLNPVKKRDSKNTKTFHKY